MKAVDDQGREVEDWMRLLLVVFMLFPLLELWLLLKVAAWLGALATVALVVLSTLLGVALLRQVGWQTVAQAQQSMTQLGLRQRISPVPALFDGFALALAGVLLVLPGLLSDVVAVLLLIAPLRRWLLRVRLAAADSRPAAGAAWHADVSYAERDADNANHAPLTIDGEYRREP